MKKILVVIVFISLSVCGMAQLSGNGTFASPYSGTFQGDLQWNSTNFPSGKVYIGGDVTIDNENLVIEAGMNIIFVALGADLIITSTGQLTASGSSSGIIRFTADFNDNGVYGETGERWGHISFQNMSPGFTSPSVLNYCIIEYGQKSSSPYGIEAIGGGLQINYTYVNLSNSTIRNNYAGWGGGVFVDSNSSPSISNNIITNNTAGTTAGGMFIYQSSASVITNCLIYKNTVNGGGGGGGVFVGDFPENLRFYNCVISSNISNTFHLGDNIRIYKSSGAPANIFNNTIVWGSNSSVNYYLSTPTLSDFTYCAIQNPANQYTNCITLNATNNDPAGPNFFNVTPGSEDYHIFFISPCRDIGTSSGAPSVDYDGNLRIGPWDVGAFEVQYSRWLVNASSTGEWDGVFSAVNWEQGLYPSHPNSTGDVVIPLLTSSVYAPSIGTTVFVNPNKSMILEPGAMATFGALTNNGTLLLKSDASNISSLITDSYAGNPASVQLYLTGGGTKTTYKWHYISSPIASLPVSTFSPTYTLDLAQYVESRPTTSLREGWVAYDGYVYSTGLSNGPTFSTLNIGQGYDYWRSADKNYTFSGQLNTGDITVNLGFSGNATLNGFNLLGNPFSSGLNWDDLITGLYYPFPPNTSKALYFTRNNVQCTYVNGVGIPSDVSGIIPPMQGFFSKTYSSGNTITFPYVSRVHDAIHPRYKGYQIIPLIRLALQDDTLSDETVIRFNNQALPGLDNDYDAIKFTIDPGATSIYTVTQGTNYAINGQPFPSPSADFPVVLNLTTDTAYSLKATQLQGLDNYDVQLIDNSTGQITNLKTDPIVNFNAVKGSVSGRFIVRVSYILTAIDNPVAGSNMFKIYTTDGLINIMTLSDDWDGKKGTVRIYDLSGKPVSSSTDREFDKNLLIQLPSPSAKGVYMIEIKAGSLKYVGKVIIR